MSAAPGPGAPRVHVGPQDQPLLEQAVRDGGGRVVPLADAEALVYRGSDEPGEVVAMLHPGVRWVQLPHAGVERWTSAGLVTRDPVWTSAAGAYAPQVAEHVLALLLAAARDLPAAARARSWGPKTTRSLAGSTVALVGAGGIARSLVALLAPLGCRVLAVAGSGPLAGAERTVPRERWREVLGEADHVVLMAPSTPATRGMVDAEALAAMRPTAWLHNVARGDLVETAALVQALAAGTIAGAALDVTDPEPLPDGHPLWSEPRALITPHAANPDDAYWPALVQRVRENTARFAAGEPLLAPVEPGGF